ncbi:MAG: arginine--tRNA ligase [Planctomycetaceae bacterium]|jgi:arginyl-tRNA synthetase|nr:arginine--tRNA ligase [Planctomycetaceae bacterium]
MNIQTLLKRRFEAAVESFLSENAKDAALDKAAMIEMIRPSQEPKFGDYQANMAMPIGKRLGKPPREIAQQIVSRLQIGDVCEMLEIAGPGFINLRLKNDWILSRLQDAKRDSRLGVAKTDQPKTYLVDYSAPNVAKPMHVGHIRSTVIGNALANILRFYGHKAITDNHLGDWGTQFGMIIYGYRRFLDCEAYRQKPVEELARLYRLVRKLIDYHQCVADLSKYEEQAVALQEKNEELNKQLLAVNPSDTENNPANKDWLKKLKKEQTRLLAQIADLRETVQSVAAKIAAVHADSETLTQALRHLNIGRQVLEETSKLHRGDKENLALWNEFLPFCKEDINRIYKRLNVSFDHTLGESFYNDRLPELTSRLIRQGIARETDGAVGVFLDAALPPMLIQKKDGAFLYATTDLATIEYRVATFQPDSILYVVDFRQSLHFEQIFAVARMLGYDLEMTHVKFGTVLGEDGKPFKTRAGDTVGLESLLDEAERRAYEIVKNNDELKTGSGELSEEQRRETARKIGIGALIYADLSQNRESDYTFSYDKMLAMNGNTATYLQYAYARVQSIFARGGVEIESLRNNDVPLQITDAAERSLALDLLKFEEAVELTLRDYRPNILTAYLYELANRYASFFEQCPVLRADSELARNSRLILCDLVARTLKTGLELLGIETVEKM